MTPPHDDTRSHQIGFGQGLGPIITVSLEIHVWTNSAMKTAFRVGVVEGGVRSSDSLSNFCHVGTTAPLYPSAT